MFYTMGTCLDAASEMHACCVCIASLNAIAAGSKEDSFYCHLVLVCRARTFLTTLHLTSVPSTLLPACRLSLAGDICNGQQRWQHQDSKMAGW
jgi:hypothetical protein